MIALTLRALRRALGPGLTRDDGRHRAGAPGATFPTPVFHPPGTVRLVSPAEAAALAAPRAAASGAHVTIQTRRAPGQVSPAAVRAAGAHERHAVRPGA